MSDVYLSQHDADQQVIESLLKQLRSNKNMTYLKLANGEVACVETFTIVDEIELHSQIGELEMKLNELKSMLPEPVAEQTAPAVEAVPVPEPVVEAPVAPEPQPETQPEPTPEQPAPAEPVVTDAAPIQLN